MMAASRISQQLLGDYNPRHLGVCGIDSRTMLRCFTCSKAPLLPFRWYPFGFECPRGFSRYRVGTGAPYSSASSSAIANDSGDLTGVSFFNSARYTSEALVSTDRMSPTENGQIPSSEEATSVAGGIVALGKFDALHIGHRELAIQASKIGVPYLLSFVGMAEVLGWQPRAPIVAKCDRKRVLSSWAPWCGNIIPKEYNVDFSKVRHLTPEQFVEKLSTELGVQGVVAGQNYRFGYKAAGNASDLVRLCKDYGMKSSIINSVMDKNQEPRGKEGSTNSQEQGQVSSTRVRHALSVGDMKYVSELLGRRHRLVFVAKGQVKFSEDGKRLLAPRSCLLNLPPAEGLYNNCSLVIGGDENVAVQCRVLIDTTDIHLELLDGLAPEACISHQNFEELLGIEFGDSRALD